MFAFTGFQELWKKNRTRKALPKIGRTTVSPDERPSRRKTDWSQEESERERQVSEALYGATKERPGLDALLEEAPRILEHNRQDRVREVSCTRLSH